MSHTHNEGGTPRSAGATADVLEHATRRTMFEHIARSPGAAIRTLARVCNVDDKTILHHARVLEEAGLVVLTRAGHRTSCYRPGDERADAGLSPELAAVLRAVASGVARPSDVARAVGVPRGTAWGQLAALQRRGLVTSRGGRWASPSQRFSREPASADPSRDPSLSGP